MWKKQLEDLPGIGKKILLLKDGKFPGINKKVTTIADLAESDIAKLPLESQLALKYLTGEPYDRYFIDEFKSEYMQKIKKLLKAKYAIIAGSYRRQLPQSNDVDLLLVDPDITEPDNYTKLLSAEVAAIFVRAGSKKSRFLVQVRNRWIPVDMVFVESANYIAALMHYTGSKEFNIKMSTLAIRKGCILNEYALKCNGKIVKLNDEIDIFKKLNHEYIAPNERIYFEEIKAAQPHERLAAQPR